MKHTDRRITRRILLATLVVVGVASVASRFVVNAAQPKARFGGESSPPADTSVGLRLAQDRLAGKWLDEARVHLERREFVVAASLFGRVFDSDNDSFADDSSDSLVAREEAWRLTKRLSDDVRLRLEADLDRVALDAWSSVRTGNSPDEIAVFASRHRFSVSGLTALCWLAAARRDTGRHESAAAAWARVAEHPRATMVQRTVARLARIESLNAANHQDEAVRVCNESLTAHLSPTISLGGRSVSARDWIVAKKLHLLESHAKREGSPRSPEAVMRNLLESDPSPAPLPSWTRPTPAVAPLAKSLTEIQRYFRGQGVVSSLATRPLVVGQVVLARTMEHLIALDLKTGEPVWREPVSQPEYSWISENPKYLENDVFKSNLTGAWHLRTEADSVFGSLATDGRAVVAVMEPDRSRFGLPLTKPARLGPQNDLPQNGPNWNRLVAYEIATGELRWQIGGKPTGPADVYGGLRFLGPPLPVDDLLFGVARRQGVRSDELSLLAIDNQTGHLRWSVPLGIMPAHLAETSASQRIACPVTLVDGRLLCPTASGALLAVDPVTRSICWACRYPVDQQSEPPRPVNGIGSPTPVDAWWNAWREVACASSSQTTILVSPESDKLHAIDPRNGRRIWSASRSGALHLAGLFDDLVIVIEPMAVRAHDLQTGAIRWRCETGEISGRGTIAGAELFQPRRAGGVSIIDLRDGSRQDSLVNSDAVLGTLIPCEEGWVSQTDRSIIKLPLLTRARSDAFAKWTTNRTDEAAALDLARLDMQAGEPAAARSRLLDIETRPAKDLRREALLALLRPSERPRVFEAAGDGADVPKPIPVVEPHAAPFDMAALSKELLALSESNDERLMALRAIGDAASINNDPLAAMSSYLEGIELIDASARKSVGEWSADGVAARSVRRDRAFVGGIERVLTDATHRSKQPGAGSNEADLLASLKTAMDSRLENARKNSDPFAVQRLVDRMLPLEWGRKALLTEATAVRFARTLKKSEPALLAVSLSRDERIAEEAARQLANLYSRSGWRTEADAVERRLLIEHPNVLQAIGGTVTDESPQDVIRLEHRKQILAPPADPWPTALPHVEVDSKSPPEDVHFAAVSVDAMPGSLLDRLDVSVDRQARFVRFAGDGHAGKWTVTLGGPPSTLRTSFASLDQCEAWGVGRLLVLRLGTELFCISPLDERGEPHAKLEWSSLDMTVGTATRVSESAPSTEAIPARVGLRHEGLQLIDGFGRALGRVGPVRPDYMCFQSQARLVAIDTQTGKQLWERLDVPPKCLTFGDESYVYLWRTGERSLQVLSVIDGRTIEERPWAVSADDLLLQRGSLTWLAPSRNNAEDKLSTQIELHDAFDGSLRWSISFEAKAIPFVLDRDTLGVVEPGGKLHLVAAVSGKPLSDPLMIEVPAKVERIVCHRDDWRWYVAVSGPVERQAILQNEQIWGGRRLPFLNGSWYAIDRVTKSISWQRKLENEPLSLDASRMAPVFVQLWRQPNLDNTSTKSSDGRMRLIDKRSGREVTFRKEQGLQPYFVLFPSANRESLEIRTEREIVRLKFDREASGTKSQTPTDDERAKSETPGEKK